MKLANPLYYPLSVLIGAIALVVGVRVARLPGVVVVPTSVGLAVLGAALQKGREPEALGLENPALERDLLAARSQAETVAQQAHQLYAEATKLLTEVHEVELLGMVQYACDRAQELPAKIDHLARRMQGGDSLLSISDLQAQLKDAEARQQASSGVAREQWDQLMTLLQRNIALAQEGQDTRQAQVVSLSTLILEAAGVLQQLQNRLRSADLTDAAQASELRSLGDEFTRVQDHLNVIVTGEADVASERPSPDGSTTSSTPEPERNPQ